MVLAAVWLSARLAGFLTRRVEAPAQRWLRRRIPGPARQLLPEVAAAERAARNRQDGSR
jgi:peptidoglycan/LPS O-acetylase OafA/YrhL